MWILNECKPGREHASRQCCLKRRIHEGTCSGAARIFQSGGGGGRKGGRVERFLKIRVSKWHFFLHIICNCSVEVG